MGFVLATVRKDLRRRLADPLGLAIWIGIPALLGVLIGLFVGNGQDAPTVRVLLVNQDDSALSDLLVGTLARGGTAGGLAFELDEVDLTAGRERIDDGNATALLILPPDFGAALLDEEPTTLTLITNPGQRILPSVVVAGAEMFREGAFYAQRILGESFRQRIGGQASGPGVADGAAAVAAALAERLAAASALFDPPLLALDLGAEDDGSGRPASAGAAANAALAGFILPGMILMSILFVAQGMSADLWEEKDSGTLGRTVSSPQPLTAFLAGKLLAGLAMIAVVAIAGLAVAAAIFDVPLGRLPLAVAWCSFAGTAMLGLFFCIAMLGTSHRTSNLITMMLLFPLMMIGGSFTPFETMPAWMRAVGVWTPNGVAVRQLDALLFGRPEALSVLTAVAVIAAVAGASLLLCARRARRFAAA